MAAARELSQQQLFKLRQHVYTCTNDSLLDPYMQRWWCWLVEQFPMYVAPNLITVLGLIINIVTSLLLVYYSPYATEEVPRWACFLCCLGLFIYQSLDAIDGKQARRTKSSSPLGELFDHGCDSLSTVFVSIAVSCAVQLGKQPHWLFCQGMMAVTLFYCAHWQAYVSGKLRFGFVDVTEAQFGVMLILLISTVFGSSFWSYQVPVLGLSLRSLPTIFGTTAGSFALFDNFKIILVERGAGRNGSSVALLGGTLTFRCLYLALALSQWFMQIKTYIPVILYEGAGKNGSTIAGTSVLSPVVPLSLFVVPALMVAWKSSEGFIFMSNPLLYMFTFGFVAVRVTNRLVVAHMTKHEMAYSDASMLGPLVLLLNQFFNCIFPENWLLWIVFLYVTYDLISFCKRVCLEICEYLGIELFRIPSPEKLSKTSSHVTNGSSTAASGSSATKHDTRNRGRSKHF